MRRRPRKGHKRGGGAYQAAVERAATAQNGSAAQAATALMVTARRDAIAPPRAQPKPMPRARHKPRHRARTEPRQCLGLCRLAKASLQRELRQSHQAHRPGWDCWARARG